MRPGNPPDAQVGHHLWRINRYLTDANGTAAARPFVGLWLAVVQIKATATADFYENAVQIQTFSD
jgi:hypothetical protein